jgi:hypothetical protein
VSPKTSRRVQLGLAIGHLLPALVLGVGCYALPLRWWVMDALCGGIVVVLVIASAGVFARARWADRALYVATWTLLGVGLVLFAMFALSLAYLSSIHGVFGQMGVLSMALLLLLLLPYTIVYPSGALVLLWARRSSQGVVDPSRDGGREPGAAE